MQRRASPGGQQQIAHASQPHECFQPTTERQPQARHLGQPARDQCGARVQPEAQAVGGACRNGEHVLNGTAHFHADECDPQRLRGVAEMVMAKRRAFFY